MPSRSFIEAVQQQHLVRWLHNGFVRTLEPHLYARIGGGRDVLIAFQIAGGPRGEDRQGWKLIDVKEAGAIADTEHFSSHREIPVHLQDLVRSTYARPLPIGELASFMEPRR